MKNKNECYCGAVLKKDNWIPDFKLKKAIELRYKLLEQKIPKEEVIQKRKEQIKNKVLKIRKKNESKLEKKSVVKKVVGVTTASVTTLGTAHAIHTVATKSTCLAPLGTTAVSCIGAGVALICIWDSYNVFSQNMKTDQK